MSGEQEMDERQNHVVAESARDSTRHDYKPNKDLTPQERKAKRALKKQLKVQQKRARLETKLRHAMRRNDALTEEQTRLALRAFDKSHATSTVNDVVDPLVLKAPERDFLLNLCSELQHKQQHGTHITTKEAQTKTAVSLLRHMTKGTQARHMFQDANALWGYARQKFFERAMLVCTSFLKLQPPQESSLRTRVWEKLQSVKNVCSIGCGPGNDAIGVVAFLKALNETDPQLEHAVLLDWAIEDWKLVLEPLCDLVVPNCIQRVDMSPCDVTKPLLADSNKKVKELLVDDNRERTIDVFLVSYLLTEIRGQWHDFVKDVIELARPNALFYFAEPTPWQLHRLKNFFADDLDFVWLDSSMDEPNLQPLDNRVGPGVLLGCKR